MIKSPLFVSVFVFFFFSLSLPVFFLKAQTNAEQVDRQLFDLYFGSAVEFFRAGIFNEAAKYLAISEEFGSESLSDSFYIKAMLLPESASTLMLEELLATAWRLDNWRYIDRYNCLERLAGLLYRHKKYHQLKELLVNQVGTRRLSNESRELFLRALLRLNDESGAAYYAALWHDYIGNESDVVVEILTRYNEDYRLRIIDSIADDNSSIEKIPPAALWILSDWPTLGHDIKIKLLQQLLIQKPDDLAVRLRFYRYIQPIGAADIEQFVTLGLLENRGHLVNLKNLTLEPAADRYLTAQVQQYNGIVSEDWNSDGYTEALYHYRGGDLTLVEVDQDQNGIIDCRLRLEENLPVSMTIIETEDVTTVAYDNYPHPRQISINQPGDLLRSSFRFVDLQIQAPIIYSAVFDQTVPFRIDFDLNSKDDLFLNAFVVDVYRTKAPFSGTDFTDWQQQTAVFESYMQNYNGEYNYKKEDYTTNTGADGIYRRLFNTDNDQAPIPAQIFIDIDNDDTAEWRQTYSAGRLVEIAVDFDNNGIYEYRRYFDERAVELWDFNQDGETDISREKNEQTLNE